jgi:hypothetical protein
MKNNKEHYVKTTKENFNINQLTIEEQLELFAEIIVDELLKDNQNEKADESK